MDYILAYSKSSRRVRELENKLAFTVAKYEKEIAGLKKEILAPKIKFTSKMGQFEKVLQVACMVCNVTPAEVLSKMRRGDIMTARHLVVYLLRHDYALHYAEIGRKLHRDHSTAINSFKQFSNSLEYRREERRIYNTAKELLCITEQVEGLGMEVQSA
jgi:chromosomal replication initiator protein